MLDNLAEEIDKCPLNRGCYVLFVYNWEHKRCPLYGVAGCLLSGVSNALKSMEKRSDFQNCLLYRRCPLMRGCPLSGVPLYSHPYSQIHGFPSGIPFQTTGNT